jgi:hypothetical protein
MIKWVFDIVIDFIITIHNHKIFLMLFMSHYSQNKILHVMTCVYLLKRSLYIIYMFFQLCIEVNNGSLKEKMFEGFLKASFLCCSFIIQTNFKRHNFFQIMEVVWVSTYTLWHGWCVKIFEFIVEYWNILFTWQDLGTCHKIFYPHHVNASKKIWKNILQNILLAHMYSQNNIHVIEMVKLSNRIQSSIVKGKTSTWHVLTLLDVHSDFKVN